MAREPAPRPRVRRRRVSPDLGSLLKRVSILGLFGKYSYENLEFSSETMGSNVSVLIGDNGTGKTTILRLIYAALAPQRAVGLLTYIARTPFLELRIDLSTGESVTITKPELLGSFDATVSGATIQGAFHIQAEPDGAVRSKQTPGDTEAFQAALKTFNIDILFIGHTRKIRSTYEYLSNLGIDEAVLEKAARRNEFLTVDQMLDRTRLDSVEFPLSEIVSAIHEWFRVRAFRQGTTGEQDASSVYLEVVRTLSRRRKTAPLEPQSADELSAQLSALSEQTDPYTRHGLLSRYPFEELKDLVESAIKSKVPQIQSVLTPFLASIMRRIDALAAVQTLISAYEDELNLYFKDKHASFHVLEGLSITDKDAKLDLGALSSGEKQLVFLLTAALLSRDGRSLILVDEPELSLNYKWQRLIASSISRLTRGADSQFILATHSVEIISRHVESVVELV